jgi:uncharacterized protein YjiS (DUF1127 family)
MSVIHLQPYADFRGGLRHRHADARDRLHDGARWLLATLREWRRRTHERAELAQLDDRTLLDIGLTRADAEFLINKPFWRE